MSAELSSVVVGDIPEDGRNRSLDDIAALIDGETRILNALRDSLGNLRVIEPEKEMLFAAEIAIVDLTSLSLKCLLAESLLEGRGIPMLRIIYFPALEDNGPFLKSLGLDPFAYSNDYDLQERIEGFLLTTRNSHREVRSIPARIIHVDGLVINPLNVEVIWEGEQMRFTPKQFGIVYELGKVSGEVVPYRRLIKAVWGYDEDSRVLLKPHIFNIRRRFAQLEPSIDGSRPLILTRLGFGHSLVVSNPKESE